MEERKETLRETQGQQETVVGRKTELMDVQKRAESHQVPREVETWLHKLEVDPSQQKIVNDVNGQPLLQTTTPQQTKVVLPVTRTGFVNGFKKKFDEAGKWLSTFVLRLIKIKGGEVKFKEE